MRVKSERLLKQGKNILRLKTNQSLHYRHIENSENKPRDVYFSKALFEGLICGGASIFAGAYLRGGNLRFNIDWAILIVGRKFAVFAILFFVFEGNFLSTSPRGLIFGEVI